MGRGVPPDGTGGGPATDVAELAAERAVAVRGDGAASATHAAAADDSAGSPDGRSAPPSHAAMVAHVKRRDVPHTARVLTESRAASGAETPCLHDVVPTSAVVGAPGRLHRDRRRARAG